MRNRTPIRDAAYVLYDDPALFSRLSEAEQDAIKLWIELRLRPAKTAYEDLSSYGLKHCYEEDMRLYVGNGEFKGGLVAAGYEPVDPWERNWHFRLRPIGEIGDHHTTTKPSETVRQQLRAATDRVFASVENFEKDGTE